MALYTKPLGRRTPTDFSHVDRHRLSLRAEPLLEVNKVLTLPYWHWTHDQGKEGSCVGHGTAMERAITNSTQNKLLNIIGVKTRRYDPIQIWNEAKKVDEWPDTNPGDENGTSVRAAYDVMRDIGPSRVKTVTLLGGNPFPVQPQPPSLADGASVNEWATTVDQMRACLAKGLPVVIGVNWYSNFDTPVEKPDKFHKTTFWIGEGNLGSIRGGHCVCIYGASDRRQAFRVKNSWGKEYPLVWLPYETMQRLLNEDGEATTVIDK